jgi:hypothetical protein
MLGVVFARHFPHLEDRTAVNAAEVSLYRCGFETNVLMKVTAVVHIGETIDDESRCEISEEVLEIENPVRVELDSLGPHRGGQIEPPVRFQESMEVDQGSLGPAEVDRISVSTQAEMLQSMKAG